MTLYVRQQKRNRCKEQTLGLCGRRRGWDDLTEQHWNMYITICGIDRQSRFDAWDRALRAGALGWPWGMGWGGRREGGSGWGAHVHPWLIHVNVWQNPPQYCKVISLQLKFCKKRSVLFNFPHGDRLLSCLSIIDFSFESLTIRDHLLCDFSSFKIC